MDTQDQNTRIVAGLFALAGIITTAALGYGYAQHQPWPPFMVLAFTVIGPMAIMTVFRSIFPEPDPARYDQKEDDDE